MHVYLQSHAFPPNVARNLLNPAPSCNSKKVDLKAWPSSLSSIEITISLQNPSKISNITHYSSQPASRPLNHRVLERPLMRLGRVSRRALPGRGCSLGRRRLEPLTVPRHTRCSCENLLCNCLRGSRA